MNRNRTSFHFLLFCHDGPINKNSIQHGTIIENCHQFMNKIQVPMGGSLKSWGAPYKYSIEWYYRRPRHFMAGSCFSGAILGVDFISACWTGHGGGAFEIGLSKFLLKNENCWFILPRSGSASEKRSGDRGHEVRGHDRVPVVRDRLAREMPSDWIMMNQHQYNF